MSTHSLSNDVSRMVRRLVDLPGSKQLSVHTRRYPRLGPAERACGFEEHHWSISTDQALEELPIPADAEEVMVTWLGAPNIEQMQEQIATAVSPADSSIEWEYRVSTRRQADESSEVMVEIFNTVGAQTN